MSANPPARVLLALDGHTLKREVLVTILRRCVLLCRRVDILLVNPPREPTSCLAMLLLRLEHSGIDYRVASAYGDMGGEVLHYLNRYRGITALALIDAAQLSEATTGLIEQKGYSIIYLTTPAQAG